MIELGRVMQDAADAALGDRPVVGAAGVVARVRRRQAVRAVGTGAVGMAAVGAVAVAGMQGGWWLDGTPVATPTSADASPRPTPPPGAWPAVQVAEGETFECGKPVPTILDPEGDADLHLDATIARQPAFDPDNPMANSEAPPASFAPVAGATLTQGDYWELQAALVNGSGQTLTGSERPGSEPTAVIVADGVMVGQVTEEGITLAIIQGDEQLTLQAGAREERSARVRWTACPAGSEVRALPAGGYDVYVLHTVSRDRPRSARDVAWPVDWVTLVGGPYPVTLEGGVVPSQTDEANAYFCENAPPGAEDVQLSFEGLISYGCRAGTVLPIGWQIPDPVPSTSLITWDASYCAEAPSPGRWVDVWSSGSGRSFYFEVDVVDRRVVRIDSYIESTTAGIGNWSTLPDVQRAYPGLELLAPDSATGYGVDAWAVTEGGNTLVFEIAVDPDAAGPDGVGAVVAMSLLAPGTTYDRPATGSDMCR